MRTTICLDDDVLVAVKERARRERRTAGEVLSDLARQAFNNQYSGAGQEEPAAFFGFEPFGHRGQAVSNARIDQIREDDLI